MKAGPLRHDRARLGNYSVFSKHVKRTNSININAVDMDNY
jgi:hypothetical protein